MSSGILSSLAVGYSEYFPVSSFKLHRGVSVINNSQNVKPTKLQIENQNVHEIPPFRSLVMKMRRFVKIRPSTKFSNQPGMWHSAARDLDTNIFAARRNNIKELAKGQLLTLQKFAAGRDAFVAFQRGTTNR